MLGFVLTEVRLRDAWILLVLALIPAAILALLGVRALRNEEAAIRREAALAVEARAARIAGSIASSLEDVRVPTAGSDSELASTSHPSFADVVILDASLNVRHPATANTGALPAADPGCATNHDRAFVLSTCEHARTASGRFLWPIVALEPPEADARVAAWVRAHLAYLSPAERAAIRADAVRTPSPQTLAILDEARGDAEWIAAAIAEPEVRAALRAGSNTIGTASFLARARRLADGRIVLILAHAARLAPYVAAADAKLATRTEADALGAPHAFAPVTRSLGVLALHADPSRAVRSSRNVLAGVAIAGVAFALAFAVAALARLRAERRNAALRTDFVATVSHELRTPLASVRMLAELLDENRVADEERADVHAALAREARRMTDTVDRLLGFGRMAAGRYVVSRAHVRLHKIVARVIDEFEERFPDAAPVERHLEPIDADVDEAQVRLAIDNLLVNALKYAPNGKPYAVSLASNGDRVELSVEDHGEGIPRRDRRRIFQPFERGDARLSSATEGSGIGLSLVAHVARAHDGTVTVDGDHGAKFTMRFRRTTS